MIHGFALWLLPRYGRFRLIRWLLRRIVPPRLLFVDEALSVSGSGREPADALSSIHEAYRQCVKYRGDTIVVAPKRSD